MEKLNFIVEPAKEGGYNARAETESIFTQAETLEELNLKIGEAILCHFDFGACSEFNLIFHNK